MAKGSLPEGDGDLGTTPFAKARTSAAQKSQFARRNSNSSVGGTSNSLASGNMPKPLMNPNKLKIGKKKKKMRGR
jgi:hypothetical protein